MKVIVHPNPLLTAQSAEVDFSRDKSVSRLARDLINTMRNQDGVGLAAIQVGILKRVLVYDDSEDQDSPRAVVNPVITYTSEELEEGEEGCLSFPGVYFPVMRHRAVTVVAQNENGEPITIDAEGFSARVLQHEIDHLDGIMILNRAEPDIRLKAMRAYNQLSTMDDGTIVSISRDDQ